MKKLFNLLGVALISSTLFWTMPAMAQSVGNPAVTEETIMDDDDDDSGKWGWLGLLGLLGLYGLKRRDDDRRTSGTNPNR